MGAPGLSLRWLGRGPGESWQHLGGLGFHGDLHAGLQPPESLGVVGTGDFGHSAGLDLSKRRDGWM